jgi:hypothetical protein
MPYKKKTQPAVIELFPGRPKALSIGSRTLSRVLRARAAGSRSRATFPAVAGRLADVALEKPYHMELDHHRQWSGRSVG